MDFHCNDWGYCVAGRLMALKGDRQVDLMISEDLANWSMDRMGLPDIDCAAQIHFDGTPDCEVEERVLDAHLDSRRVSSDISECSK